MDGCSIFLLSFQVSLPLFPLATWRSVVTGRASNSGQSLWSEIYPIVFCTKKGCVLTKLFWSCLTILVCKVLLVLLIPIFLGTFSIHLFRICLCGMQLALSRVWPFIHYQDCEGFFEDRNWDTSTLWITCTHHHYFVLEEYGAHLY